MKARVLIAWVLCALVASASLSAAQTPNPEPPFGAPGTLAQCTPEYQKTLEQSLEALRKLQGGPAQLQPVCDAISGARTWMQKLDKAFEALDMPPVSGQIKEQIGDLGKPFGVQKLDLRFVAHLCTQTIGEAERELTTKIGQVQSELQRCGAI